MQGRLKGSKFDGAVSKTSREPQGTGKRRVVHLTSVHGPLNTRIFHKECKSLVEDGYDVVEVAPDLQDRVVDGIQIKAIRKPKSRIARMTVGVWRVYREAVKQHAELYHFHDPELLGVGLLLRAHGAKVIYDIHEDVPRTIAYKIYLPLWLRNILVPLTEWLENAGAARLSALIAATEPIAERFSAVNRHTVVVNNFPRLEEFSSGPETPWESRDIPLAYVGASLTRVRGIDNIVKAVSLLPANLSPKLCVAGRFINDGLLEDLKKNPGWDRVEHLGYLTRNRVANLLGRTRVGLVLLTAAPNYIRCRPTKLFEYMAAGIPVIASDFPDFREIVHAAGCGILVPPEDPQAIATAMEYLLTHSEEAQDMGRRGRRAVERSYVWDIEKKALLELYDSLLASSHPLELPVSAY
jgi:glycosyltransferase involved in cell wall biosynthesis